MITVVRTVRTTAAIDVVWPYLSDFTNAEKWDPATVSCTRTDAGPIDVGATYQNVSTFRGRTTTLEYTVETFDAPRHFGLIGRNKTVHSRDDLTLSSFDAGTELVYTARLRFSRLARLAEPLLKGALTKLADDTAVSLRRNLDAL